MDMIFTTILSSNDTINFWLVSLWGVVLILSIYYEIETQDLNSLWFIGAALVSLMLAIFKVEMYIQLFTFSGVSILGFISMIFFVNKTNEVVKNYESNIDSIMGKTFKVSSKKTIFVFGTDWSYDSLDEISENDMVEVIGIKGNKLKVKKVKNNIQK